MTETAYIPPPFDVWIIRQKALSLIELYPSAVSFDLNGICTADAHKAIVTYSLTRDGELAEVWWPLNDHP